MLRRHFTPVRNLKEILPRIYLMEVELKADPTPGQFFMFSCGRENLLRRPLSVHRRTKDGLLFLFKVVGEGTRWLSQRKPSDELDVLGPFGRGFSLPEKPQKLLLIGGGMGIAPIIFLAEKACALGHRVSLVIGAKTRSVLFPQELVPKGVEVFWATEDGSFGYKGKVTGLIREIGGDFSVAYASGPNEMYDELGNVLGDREVQVSVEVRMGCGFGGCFGCSIPTKEGNKLVCRDGPVFGLSSLITGW